MGTAKTIFKNTAYLGVAEVFVRLMQFVIMLYAARLLDKEFFGKFGFALSFSLIAIVIADLGINTLLVREISRKKELAGKYFVNSFVLKLALSIFTFFLAAAALNIMGYPDSTKKIVYIVLSFAVLNTFTELFYAIFRAFEKMHLDAWLKILRMILLTASSMYVLFNHLGIYYFGYAFVLSELIVAIAAFFVATKHFVKIELKLDKGLIKYILNKALPFGMAILFGSVYFYIGIVILSKLRGDLEVAAYSSVYNIVLALLFIPIVYTNAIYPVLSRYFKASKEGLSTLYERSFKYLYIIGLPISAGVFLFSGEIINILYKGRYLEASIALKIVAWFLFIKFLNFLLGIMLSSIDKQEKRMKGQGLTAIFNVILCLILIPRLGFVGAAVSTLITEIFLFGLYYLYVSESMYYFNFLKIIVRPAMAALIMAVFAKLFSFGTVYSIISSAIVYFAAIYVLGAIDKKDYEIISAIFNKNDLKQ